MIAACDEAGVQLMYAEPLCFAPKYARARELAQSGALGEIFLIKQSEEHSGPHSPWFWNIDRAGGGALMDMGVHGIVFAQWLLGNASITHVTASMGTFVHGGKTEGEDHVVTILNFDGGQMAVIESSWAKGGGVDDRLEIYGTKGHTRADLVFGTRCRPGRPRATLTGPRRLAPPSAGVIPDSTICGTADMCRRCDISSIASDATNRPG